jgi:Protein of unknown function (DUF3999)
MRRASLWTVGLLSFGNLAQAQMVSPKDFAYEQLAISTEAAPAYRFSLPLNVYQNTVHEDLADLRVFNADGIAVPFSLSRPTAQPPIHQTPVALPLFPLHEGARILIDGVHLTVNSAGSAVNLQTQNGGPTTGGVRQYLLDARALDSALSALQLAWPDTAAEFTASLGIEVSDDLAGWRALMIAAPIANLRAKGQTLVANRVEFAPTKAKFWRLSWLGAAPSVELTSILAEQAASLTEPVRASLEVIGIRDPKNAPEYTFDLSAHLPVSRLNVSLPDPNSVIDVELSSRSTLNAAWHVVARSSIYRIKTPDAEQQSSPIEVRQDTDRYWRARIVSVGYSPQAPLRLNVQWIPNEVTFLAQGHAPFLLAYGNASAVHAESDMSHLPATLTIAPARLGAAQVSGGAARLIALPAPFPRTRVALWSVLLLAVVLLSWMAYGISRDRSDNR